MNGLIDKEQTLYENALRQTDRLARFCEKFHTSFNRSYLNQSSVDRDPITEPVQVSRQTTPTASSIASRNLGYSTGSGPETVASNLSGTQKETDSGDLPLAVKREMLRSIFEEVAKQKNWAVTTQTCEFYLAMNKKNGLL